MNTHPEDVELVVQIRYDGSYRRPVLTPLVRSGPRPIGSTVTEGYDPHSLALGRPVWWRTERRGDRLIYCSTFHATPDDLGRFFGPDVRQMYEGQQEPVSMTLETDVTDGGRGLGPIPEEDVPVVRAMADRRAQTRPRAEDA